jgi:hypothetical protein
MQGALRRAAFATGLATLWLAPAVAAATAPTQASITGTISPAVASTSGKLRSVALNITTRFRTIPAGGQPATTSQAVIYFGHGSVVNARLFPSCNATRLNEIGPKACPKGSRIGAGTVTAIGAGLPETLALTAFNGAKGRSVLFYLVGGSPLKVAQAIQAPMVPVRSRFYAYKLTLTTPANLEAIAGVATAVTSFTSTINATVVRRIHHKRVRRGYIEVPLCPPGAIVPLQGVFSFLGAPTQTIASGIVCGEPPPS